MSTDFFKTNPLNLLYQGDLIEYFIIFLFLFFFFFFISLFIYAYKNVVKFTFPRYEACFENLPKVFESLEIFHISDLHLDPYRPVLSHLDLFFKKFEKEILKTKHPKILIFTGDLVSFSDSEYLKRLKLFFNRLKKYDKYFLKKYSVLGNHEGYFKIENSVHDLLTSFGIKNLDTPFSQTKFTFKGKSINIIGLPDFQTFHKKYVQNIPQNFLEKNIDSRQINLILTHNFQAIEKSILKRLNASLISFSGHTHGAQINLPIFKTLALVYIHYFSKFIGGFYNPKKKKYVCISRGIGHSFYFPFRLNAPAEVPVVVLRKF